jgi:hypothetical protein
MRRRTFDKVVSSIGLVLTVGLIVASGLLFWGYSFANNNVHDQLAQQKIFFPKAGSDALKPKEIGPYLNKYAGQQLVNGDQARAYADHFIAVHLTESTGGKTYAELGAVQSGLRAQIADAKAKNDPNVGKLQEELTKVTATRETAFKGETLRGLLLEAYGFWKIGQLALIGSIASMALAAVMLVFSIIGFWHATRVPAEEEIMAPAPLRKLA